MTVPTPPWGPAAPPSPPSPPSGLAASRKAGLEADSGRVRPAAVADPEETLTFRAIRPPAPGVEDPRLLPHVRWPLLIAILTVQAVLSLHLVWSTTAYTDEAEDLWAGHLEIAHLLHGAPIPAFQSWFSGAPVIYPPIGALADALGGLTGARILSLVFMLGATALLWSTTSKLFGLRAAFFAAALFAVLGPTQFQGALATYDAMALLLVAGSVWCVVAARDHRDSTVLLIGGISLLALANATKYSSVLFDPVVIALAALVVAAERGRKPALGRGGYFAASVIAIVAALLTIAGPKYVTGLVSTTLARSAGHDSPFLVLEDAVKWAGVAGVLAWVGVAICWRRGTRAQTLVLAVLAATWFLAPLNQARLETITSLAKNVDFGTWLAAPAAGYALAELTGLIRRRDLSRATAGLIAAVVLAPAASLGWAQSSNLFRGWANYSQVISPLHSDTQNFSGNYLAEDDDVPAYYLRGSVPWQRWSNTWYFSYTPPGGRQLTGTSAFAAAIHAHYFKLIVLNFNVTRKTDSAIVGYIKTTHGYHYLRAEPTSLGHVSIWAYDLTPRAGR